MAYRILRTLIAIALLIGAGCRHEGAGAQLVDSTAAARSWVPTLQMVAGKWVANSVPQHFVVNAAEAAEKELDAALRSVDTSEASPALRDRVRRDLASARQLAAKLREAAESDDRRGALPLLAALPPLHRDLEAWKASAGSRP